MKTVAKIVECQGKCHDCREILFGKRYSVYNSKAICISTFVTLPKVYHLLSMDYMKPFDFMNKETNHIIYSFLFIKAIGEQQASEIMQELKASGTVEVYDPEMMI